MEPELKARGTLRGAIQFGVKLFAQAVPALGPSDSCPSLVTLSVHQPSCQPQASSVGEEEGEDGLPFLAGVK